VLAGVKYMYISSPAAQFLVVIVALAVFHAIMLAIAGFAFAEFLLPFCLQGLF